MDYLDLLWEMVKGQRGEQHQGGEPPELLIWKRLESGENQDSAHSQQYAAGA